MKKTERNMIKKTSNDIDVTQDTLCLSKMNKSKTNTKNKNK